jgi:hypothetical protein
MYMSLNPTAPFLPPGYVTISSQHTFHMVFPEVKNHFTWQANVNLTLGVVNA